MVVARTFEDVLITRSDERDVSLELKGDDHTLGTIQPTGLPAPSAPGGAPGGAFRHAEILARVPVWRPLGEGQVSRWTFGIVRCRFDGEDERPGLFDTLEVFSVAQLSQLARSRPAT
jgi:hypothetical protein